MYVTKDSNPGLLRAASEKTSVRVPCATGEKVYATSVTRVIGQDATVLTLRWPLSYNHIAEVEEYGDQSIELSMPPTLTLVATASARPTPASAQIPLLALTRALTRAQDRMWVF